MRGRLLLSPASWVAPSRAASPSRATLPKCWPPVPERDGRDGALGRPTSSREAKATVHRPVACIGECEVACKAPTLGAADARALVGVLAPVLATFANTTNTRSRQVLTAVLAVLARANTANTAFETQY